MSGVYICGIPMPKENSLRLIIHPNGEVVFPTRNYAEVWPGVRAIPVSDHGRLIDADALREDWLENGENEYVYDTNAILCSLDEAPTIIPADKEGEK